MPGARAARMLMIIVALVVVAGLLLGMVAAPSAI
jgi:phosphotransferase system  glucose/maltose/N-acetylglucosamine-specific IIC component